METRIVGTLLLLALMAGCRTRQPQAGLETRAMDSSSMNGHLYSDQEVQGIVKIAEDLIPPGQSLAKREVFRRLNLDPRRLRDSRSHELMNTYVEEVQISENFDLTWMSAAQDKTPLGSEERQIYGVRVVPRKRANGSIK